MIEISFYPSFIRAYKKRLKNNSILEKKFNEKLEIFKQNPFDTSLKTHKLTGQMNELYSFSIDFNCRIVFSFYTSTKVIFLDIGSHDDVY